MTHIDIVGPGFTPVGDSGLVMETNIHRSLAYISENATKSLFRVRDVDVKSSQQAFNPEGQPIGDIVDIKIMASTIGKRTFSLQFFYDPYDWSFPPDLIIPQSTSKPTLGDVGLDYTWKPDDESNLFRVLGKVCQKFQERERRKVAVCENDKIRLEYGLVQSKEEMDCCLLQDGIGPTQVIFAVPFFISYQRHGKPASTKVVAKIQYKIGTLRTDAVISASSEIETLTEFEFPNIFQNMPKIDTEESIPDYIGRVTAMTLDHIRKREQGAALRRQFIEALAENYAGNLLECDTDDYSRISLLVIQESKGSKQDTTPPAIVSIIIPDEFPNDKPKVTIQALTALSETFEGSEDIPVMRYSPRWAADRMLQMIQELLWEAIPQYFAKLNSS